MPVRRDALSNSSLAEIRAPNVYEMGSVSLSHKWLAYSEEGVYGEAWNLVVDDRRSRN